MTDSQRQFYVNFAKKFCDEHGRSPSSRDVSQAEYRKIKSLFGGWAQFLASCGLPLHPRTPSPERLKKTTNALAEELGRAPYKTEFLEHDPSRSNELKHWNKILKEAGLPVNRVTGTTKEELVERVLLLANHLKRTPTRKDFNQQAKEDNLCTAMVVQRYFRTWTDFLMYCGFEPNRASRRPRKK